MTTNDDLQVVVIGGCGHVGLPLALALADVGCRVTAFDISSKSVDLVNSGQMPFSEPEFDHFLSRNLENGRFSASTDPACISSSSVVIVVIGTPVDEHLNPDAEAVPRAVSELGQHLRENQLLILRSTVYPGVTSLVARRLSDQNIKVDLAFCPERIAEGKAHKELFSLPQIVSGTTPRATERASELFKKLTTDIIETTPEEAELAKLFTNTWRYIKFAAANQLYMIANDYGQDFEKIRHAITHEYPRAQDMPGAGFAAGPCLFKDTMQLAAFNNNNFTLGHASMMVNEGLPLYLVSRLEDKYPLQDMRVGILGMAFKGDSDDVRSSLSYKLKRILRFKTRQVLCTDAHIPKSVDATLVSLEEVIESSDLLFIGAPHTRYRNLRPKQPVVDIWNVLGNGVKV